MIGAVSNARLNLRHLTENHLHVWLRERSQGLRPDVSECAGTQSERGYGNVIRRLEDCDDVVLSKRPE